MFPLPRLLPALVATIATGLVGATHLAWGQTSTEYTVVFNSTWSAETHPLGFPPNPHYSGLIGGTHNNGVAFWELGALASEGMELMAETGSKTVLQAEVNDAITAGTAEFVLSGGSIGRSPGSVEMSFEISEEFPLVTLVSMLAPSPDWWVGVGALDLRPGGEWVDELVVDLVIYDAGTDSGTEYTSPNMNTDPAVPIFIKMDGPFAVDNIIGTFTFSREVASVGELDAITPRLLLPLTANPLRDVARFQISPDLVDLISAQRSAEGSVKLDVFDTRGAHVRSLLRGLDLRTTSVVEWDGRSGRGTLMPTGTYFLTLRAGRVRQAEKIVIVR